MAAIRGKERKMQSLEDIKKWVHACINCGSCRYLANTYIESCPAGAKFEFEPYYGGGKVWLAQYLVNENGEITDSVLHKIYACPVCGNCSIQCELEISDYLIDIIEGLRAEAVKRGVGPLPNQKVFGESISEKHNPYQEEHSGRLNWTEGLEVSQKNNADIFYFVGCTSSYRQKDLARQTVKLLNKLGVDYTVSEDEWCCGSPAMRTGQLDEAKEVVDHNIDLIKNIGAKTVITSCAGCYRTLKEDFPRYADKLEGVEILHISEFLKKMLKEGKLDLSDKEFKAKVTYHDPCHLGRHSGVYDAPREIIKAIPGINLVEMPRNRENAWCCGAGGGVKAGFKEWSLEIASERVNEAEGTEAEYLLCACPFCKTGLTDAIEATNSDLKFLDIVNLLNEIL
ncbi:MAG: (Fe-S)-binding protein [Candidatus Lokiarchaeota archaeon]|nr:(Fe-S)-binding protein [Candidatus Lokiarchaeota archaeon]